MVCWNFSIPGFRVNSDDFRAPLTINRTEVLVQLRFPAMSLEQLVSQEPIEAPALAGRPVRRRTRIPARIKFADSLTK
jgi:hypothetical protein